MLKHDAYVAVGRGAAARVPGGAPARGGRGDRRPRLAVLGAVRPDDRPALPRGRRGRLDLAGDHRRAARRPATTRRRISRLPQRRARSPPTPWQPPARLAVAPRAVFVGRLAPEKGLDTLVDAWPLVRAAHPRARLTLIGEGPGAARPGGPGRPARAGRRGRAAGGDRRPDGRLLRGPTCSSSPRARRG